MSYNDIVMCKTRTGRLIHAKFVRRWLTFCGACIEEEVSIPLKDVTCARCRATIDKIVKAAKEAK